MLTIRDGFEGEQSSLLKGEKMIPVCVANPC